MSRTRIIGIIIAVFIVILLIAFYHGCRGVNGAPGEDSQSLLQTQAPLLPNLT